MRPRVRRSGALSIALLLVVPTAGGTQTVSSSVTGLAGDWEGWARLTNDWPDHACRYEGAKDEVSVRMELTSEDGRLQGSVAIDLPAAEGSGCPPLRKRYLVTDVVSSEGVLSLSDSGGHDWALAMRRGGSVLTGLMAWQRGATEEPLADGFSFADGTRPLSRLRGEVRLRKVVAPDAAEASTESVAEGGAAGPAAPETTSAGQHFRNLGAVLGVTAVGLGALYGVNELGKGGAEEGTITCSPRHCVVGAPNAPCFCEGNVVSGEPCGDTESGVEIGGACHYPDMPCQALLSCNSGICEDQFGRCPF
jgi:hypothetical protein